MSSRDFDYGVGDDLYNAVEQLRSEIASRIRHAARLRTSATSEEKVAFELAARIAETVPLANAALRRGWFDTGPGRSE